MKFQTLYGQPIDNIVDYIKNYLSTKENVEILIGADSQNVRSRKTVFGTVIALYIKGKGAHVLCSRESVPVMKNTASRLMLEVWKSVELAEFLRENGLPKPSWIDLDLNPDPKFKSNQVLRQAVGLVEGMGYKVRYKQLGALTTYAANHLVRL